MARRGARKAGLVKALTGAVLLSCLAALSGAIPATAASNSPATGASAVRAHPSAWQVVYRLVGSNISTVAAAGPDSAWAAANFWDRKGVPRGQLLHWDGTGWRLVTYPDQRNQLIYAIFALSATDVWFSANGNGSAELLHWVNGSWSTMTTLPINAQNVDVLSDTNIWLVGGSLPHCTSISADSQGCTVTSHWNGSTWTSYPLRAFEDVTFAASSAPDVWAVGDSFERIIRDSPSFIPFVFHWTGSAWQRTGLRLHRTFWSPSIVPFAPRDVYVAESTKTARNACAMHWNGSHWRPFYLPGSGGPCKWTISDYHRGLWFFGAPSPGFRWVHWTGGRFVTTPAYVPSKNGWDTNGFTLAAVPHSKSVWLFGSYTPLTPHARLIGVIGTLR